MLFLRPLIFMLALWLATPMARAETAKLSAYNAPISESSISGISSGAYMAVQFGVVWSSVITGVGVVSGGPYFCTKTTALSALTSGGAAPLYAALGPCMAGPPGDLTPLFREADTNAASGAIDPIAHIARQKIYLFRGYNDAVIALSVTDAAAAFYRHYLGAAAGNLFYQTTLGAGHSFVVKQQGQADLNACPDNQTPFIDQCGYDQAGVLLQHIYGALNPPNTGTLSGRLTKFDQSAYTGSDIPDALSLADQGYLYVPADCARGEACRIHIALHGCKQSATQIKSVFVDEAGYNAWADSNHIIVLYPQTKPSSFLPLNPNACWDWWGYLTFDDGYVTKAGKQIAAIKRMLDALTAGAQGAAPPAAQPFRLALNDRSDTGAALAWTASPGAEAYRVFRASADGVYSVVADVAGLSFADSGLTPLTAYTWQAAPLIGGVAQSPSNAVLTTTVATTPACAKPGSCADVSGP